jgi:hypothetical protein
VIAAAMKLSAPDDGHEVTTGPELQWEYNAEDENPDPWTYVRAIKVQVDMATEQYKDRASHRPALSAPASYRGRHVYAGLAITFASS